MLIVYRACSVPNPVKTQTYPKVELVKKCFASFCQAFQDLEYNLIVLLDKPTAVFRDIFKGHKAEETYYPYFNEGNVNSFHRQIDLALDHKTDFLFVEDDYLFLPHSGKKITEAVKELGFITPYDHPGYYIEKEHEYKRQVTFTASHHWQTVISTTLTFGGRYEMLKKEADTMKKYGYADHYMWKDITQRHKLWAPIPSLATHMEEPHLAPGIEWHL